MAAADDDLKDRILAEIAAHIRVYGRERWDLIRENPAYAHLIGKVAGAVGKRKFYRWVDSVTGGVGGTEDGARRVDGPEIAAEFMDDARKRAMLAAQKNIPAAPSPAYLARKGPDADTSINFLAAVHRLMDDGEKLRAYSVVADDSSADGERIKIPHMFKDSINARMRVMEGALRVMQEIWDLQYQQRFYDEITNIIVEEVAAYPDVQLRIIERLEKLNNRRGMTLHADPMAA